MLKPCFLKVQNRECPEANYFFSLNAICGFNRADEKTNMSLIQFGVIMTSLLAELLLYIESSPERGSIILLRPYKILERFLGR